MEERTGWRGQNKSQIEGKEKRNGRLVGAAETSKECAEWCRLQRKNLTKLGLLKRKERPQYHRESSWQICQSHPYQKEKEQSHQSRVPDHEEGESQGGQEPHLGKREGDHSESMERKGRASKKSLPGRSRREHEQVSGCKSSPGRSAEPLFHSKSGQT